MSDVFKSIKKGMEEAIDHQTGKKTGIRIYRPAEVDVKAVREGTGLT